MRYVILIVGLFLAACSGNHGSSDDNFISVSDCAGNKECISWMEFDNAFQKSSFQDEPSPKHSSTLLIRFIQPEAQRSRTLRVEYTGCDASVMFQESEVSQNVYMSQVGRLDADLCARLANTLGNLQNLQDESELHFSHPIPIIVKVCSRSDDEIGCQFRTFRNGNDKVGGLFQQLTSFVRT